MSLKPIHLFLGLFLAGMLLVLITYPVLAWPERAPDRATINGPGLPGEIEITDHEILAALSLGTIEDFEHGSTTAPSVGQGYQITRYFYDASFNFGRLHYYPNLKGRDYIFFEDGPDLVGDHTPYNQQWFYATSRGETAIQRLLQELDVPATQIPVETPPNISLPFGAGNYLLVFAGLTAGSVLALVIGVIVWRRG